MLFVDRCRKFLCGKHEQTGRNQSLCGCIAGIGFAAVTVPSQAHWHTTVLLSCSTDSTRLNGLSCLNLSADCLFGNVQSANNPS
jgi:hypothetical protein